jgi:hypothetical protein
MCDASKIAENAGFNRIALARPLRDIYDAKTERQFSEWAIKSAMLTTKDEADPLVFVPDLSWVMQLSARAAQFKEVP